MARKNIGKADGKTAKQLKDVVVKETEIKRFVPGAGFVIVKKAEKLSVTTKRRIIKLEY